MRLLVLTYEFPPLGGGAGNAAAELVRALADRERMEVTVVTSSLGPFRVSKGEFTPNSTIYYLPVGKETGNIHYQTNAELMRYGIRCHRFLREHLRERSYDFCHAVMTVPAGVNAWLIRKKTPYLISLQGSDVPGYADRYKLLYAFLTPVIHRIWKDAAGVVANSRDLRRLALRGAPKQPIDVIPNGIDRTLFSHRGERFPDDGKLHVVCVGRLIGRKGVWELVKGMPQVIEKIPNAHLDLVGDGPLEEPLRRWVGEAGIADHVTLHGLIDRKDLPKHLRSASLFALPSHNEGMSNALLEGIACGLPIVVTDTGGTKELLDGNGLLTPKRDLAALASAIVVILRNEERRRQMVEASLRVADLYSWQKLAADYLRLYDPTPAERRAREYVL